MISPDDGMMDWLLRRQSYYYEVIPGDRIVEQLDDDVWRTTCFHPEIVHELRGEYPVHRCPRCNATHFAPYRPGPTILQVHTANIVDQFIDSIPGTWAA